MNELKKWIVASREQEKRHPKMYINYYLDRLITDDKAVLMTRETYDEILRNCHRYDGTLPTGVYCGKMFVRGDCLCCTEFTKRRR